MKTGNCKFNRLYKLMDGKGATEVGTILKLLHALGYNLTVTKRIVAAQPACCRKKKAKGK